MDFIQSVINFCKENWGTIITVGEGLVVLINAIRKFLPAKTQTMAVSTEPSILTHILDIINPFNVFRNIK